MEQTPDSLYKLQICDADRVTEVLSLAFKNDPKFISLFSGGSSVAKRVNTLIRFLVEYTIRYGFGYAISDACEGVALWQDSFSGFNLMKALKSGFLNLIKGIPLSSLLKLVRSYSVIVKYQQKVFPEQYMGLELLGVDPDHQKQGYADTLVRYMLKSLDYRKLPCCLMTNTEVNVRIYKKYAFETVGVYLDKETAVYSYYMMREPQNC